MALSTPFSSCCANMLPIVYSEAAMYNFILLSFRRGESIGGLVKYDLISSKAFWCSGSYLNTSSFFKRSNGEKACVLPLRFNMNLLRKFIFPNKDCNSFFVEGALVSTIAVVFFWLISIPFLWTTKPKKSPAQTPNAHFNGFIFNPYCLILSNDRRK